jgi:rubrerythrin
MMDKQKEKPQVEAPPSTQGIGYEIGNSHSTIGKRVWECLMCGTTWTGNRSHCPDCRKEGRMVIPAYSFEQVVSELYPES